MAGIFAMATALLTPEFVENFDPEKLASKFVRVEREFGVKFNKLNSSFAIVGNWKSVRDARISLLKLISDEDKGNSKSDNDVETNDRVEKESNAYMKPASVSSDNSGIIKTAGNPRRGRYIAKDKKYSNVPEPVFFLQYQDQTYSTAESLDLNSVLDDFEKTHYNKAVKKEDLKKIFEKNKDQMGKPLEKGIPKGAIIPVRKTSDKTHDDIPSSKPNNTTSDALNLQFAMSSQTFSSLSSPASAASSSNILSSANLEMMNGQYSSYHISRSESNNYVNSLPVSTESNMNSVGASLLQTISSPRIDNQNFCSIFENYDPQSFLNTPVSMGLTTSTMNSSSQDDLNNQLKNSVPSQQPVNVERLSIFATDQNELQMYTNDHSSTRTDQQIELDKLEEIIKNTSDSMKNKQYTSALNESLSSNSNSHGNASNVTVDDLNSDQHIPLGSFDSLRASHESNVLSRADNSQSHSISSNINEYGKLNITGNQLSTRPNVLPNTKSDMISSSDMNVESICRDNTNVHPIQQWETTHDVNVTCMNLQQVDERPELSHNECQPTEAVETKVLSDDRTQSIKPTADTESIKLSADIDQNMETTDNNNYDANHWDKNSVSVKKAEHEEKTRRKPSKKKLSSDTDEGTKAKKIRKAVKKNSLYESSSVKADIDNEKEAKVDPEKEVEEDVGDTKHGSTGIQGKTKSDERVFKCTECDYQGHKKKRLSEHMGRVHGLLIDGKDAQNSSYLCDLCEKSFVFEKDLNRHKKIVHHGQIFTCQFCLKTYKSKYVYDRHLATHAEGYIQPKFKCQICEREFTTKFSLSSHIKSDHLGVKKTYSCPICSKTFSQIRSYRQHANVHAGIRPYICEICGKSFTYDKSLKEHRYMHDTIRRFSCTVCGKSFRQQTCLLIHMKTHKEKKDHICSVCGREFTQKQSLLRHERIHSGDKPYMCKICFKSFGDHAVIRKHVMMAHKRSKESWKDAIFTEPREKSSHYIEGGPGYTPREYSTKILKNNPASMILSSHPDGMVVVAPFTSISNDNNICNTQVTDSESQAKSESNEILEQPAQSHANNYSTLYHMETFSQPVDVENMDSLKSKQQNYNMDSLNGYSLEPNSSLDQYNSPSLSDQDPAISESIYGNVIKKISPDEAYAAQFLNLPVATNKGSNIQATEHDVNFQPASSDADVINADLSTHSTVAMATSSSSWNYACYPSSFYSPASFSQYPTSPGN